MAQMGTIVQSSDDPPSQLQFTSSRIDHSCGLDSQPASPVRLTGIVCALGSSSKDRSTLLAMIENGMTIATINCSKASHRYFGEILDNVRAAAANHSVRAGVSVPVALALETRGAEIRTGALTAGLPEEVKLKKGETVKIMSTQMFEDKCSSEHIWVSHPKFGSALPQGSVISINEGQILLNAKSFGKDFIECSIVQGGMLGSRKLVQVPGVTLDNPSLAETDEADIRWGLERGINLIFASAVKHSDGVRDVRNVLVSANVEKHVKIFAKIDNYEGWNNFNDILDAADGVVVARDQLGKCISPEKVFLAQKAMVARCNRVGKPVIVSGQVLESMVAECSPTRIESSDISTAVLDGVDCVALSAETSMGKYPAQSVASLSAICREAESAVWHHQIFLELTDKVQGPLEASHASAISAVKAAIKSHAKSIICITTSGKTAFLVAKYSPPCPVISVTRNPQVARDSLLYRGILPIVYEGKRESDWMLDVSNMTRYAINYGVKSKFLKIEDPIIVISRWNTSDSTDTVRIVVETVNRYNIEK